MLKSVIDIMYYKCYTFILYVPKYLFNNFVVMSSHMYVWSWIYVFCSCNRMCCLVPSLVPISGKGYTELFLDSISGQRILLLLSSFYSCSLSFFIYIYLFIIIVIIIIFLRGIWWVIVLPTTFVLRHSHFAYSPNVFLIHSHLSCHSSSSALQHLIKKCFCNR